MKSVLNDSFLGKIGLEDLQDQQDSGLSKIYHPGYDIFCCVGKRTTFFIETLVWISVLVYIVNINIY